MLHISLFSGIGGFDLASEWVGWTNIVSCEINPFGRKVLEYYWPNAYHHDDIKTLTYTKLNEELTKKHGADWRADDIVLTGGFPCQPYSLAGKRLGTEDERHLWPEMLRVIREVSPKWIVGENVFGLVNWSDGLVFHEVQTDLENLGYEVQSYVLPACGVNAPHRRDRIFIIAYANNTGGIGRLGEIQAENEEIPERNNDAELGNASNERPTTDTNSGRLEGSTTSGRNGKYVERQDGNNAQANQRTTTDTSSNGCKNGCSETIGEKRGSQQGRVQQLEGVGSERATTDTERIGHPRRTQTSGNNNAERIGRMDTKSGRNGDEIRSEIERCSTDTGNANATDTDTERLQCTRESAELEGGRFSKPHPHSNTPNWDNFPTQSPICTRNDGISAKLDGITFPKWRNESIKAGGNAVVPPLIYNIFKTIEKLKNFN